MKYDKKLLYNFTPAAFISNFVPLVVILYEEELELRNFEYKMWNIITVQESVANNNQELLQNLIEDIAEEYECEEHIYLYGSGISGYGAVLQGVLCKANAVYAYNPKIKLLENDLTHLLNPIDTFPIFYLCNSQNSPEVNGFVEVCKKYEIKLNLEHCPESEYDAMKNLKEVLDFFERMVSQV